MTNAPALQALIDEWSGLAVRRIAEGYGVCAEALQKALQTNPIVPLDELRLAVRDGTVFALIDRYSPQPPNPHPQGTYLWAKEEHERGQRVKRRSSGCYFGRADENTDWESYRFSHSDFTAADWEVVK